MPATVLKALAKKSEKSVQDLERYWKEAKESAKDKGFTEDEDRFWAYTMGIVKRRAGLSEDLQEFVDFITNNLTEEEITQVRSYLDKERLEKPANFSLLSQYAQVAGISEDEVLSFWEAAKKEAKKFQAETGIEGKDVIEMALKIFVEMLPTPAEQKEKEEVAKAEDEKSKGEESEDEKPKEKSVAETFADTVLSKYKVDEALGNVMSKEEIKAMKKAGIDVNKIPKKELEKKLKVLRKKSKSNSKALLGLFGIGIAGFLGGYVAGKALDKAFSLFQTR